jgi:hypothetical protein
MDSIVTPRRKWSRAEIASLLVSGSALAELKLEHALQIVRLLTLQHKAAGVVLIVSERLRATTEKVKELSAANQSLQKELQTFKRPSSRA